MLENLHFSYNGESSKDKGVVLVNPSNGLYKEPFLPNRKIVETKVAGRSNPFFQRVESDPLSFSLRIYLPEWKERNNLRDISRWLFQGYYKPLIFEYNPDVIYYAIIEGKSELTHNGLQKGYIDINVRLNSPYIYSIPHVDEFKINGTHEDSYYNNGDLPLRFNLEVKMNDNGSFWMETARIDNNFVVSELLKDEIMYVDSEYEIITSSLEKVNNRYIAGNHTGNWLTIEPESSEEIIFYGNADVKLMYQYRYLNVDVELGNGGI